jgi:hypothetical protein
MTDRPAEIPDNDFIKLLNDLSDLHIKWENYPEQIPPRKHRFDAPNRWGHYGAHPWAQYHKTWHKIERAYDIEVISRLDDLYPPAYYSARIASPLQKIAFAFCRSNWNNLMSAVGDIVAVSVNQAVAEATEGRRAAASRKRKEKREHRPLLIDTLFTPEAQAEIEANYKHMLEL